MRKLVLVDGNAVLHRAYHAMPDLTNYKGEHIGALHGMVSMLLRIIQDLKPTHIVFCFDEKGENFRHNIFRGYQSARPMPVDGLQEQLDRAKDLIEAFNIPCFSLRGFEADDVIGTIAEKAVTGEKKFDEIVIVTGDRDLLQLVDDTRHISLYMPVKGLSDAKLYHEKEVFERMGVQPNQIVSLKALIGDGSDNYNGVPGIGPKTAEKLLAEYGTFENVYKHINEIPESTKKKLEAGKENGELSFTLATIVRDCDVDFKPEKANTWGIDSSRVLKKFSEIGFKTLIERVKKVGKELNQENQGSLF